MSVHARGELARRVAHLLAARRRALHVTQEQLAERTGMLVKNLQRLESGQENMQLDTVERLATALGTTLEALVRGSTIPEERALPPQLRRLEAAGFRVRLPTERGRKPGCAVVVTTLRAAAGGLGGAARAAERLGWVDLPRNTTPPAGQFVAEVEGRSMEPRIPHGSLCLFGPPGLPPYRDRIVLVSLGAFVDDDASATFALKRIQSIRRRAEGTRVVLASINPDVRPIVIETHADGDFRVAAELLEVLVHES